MKIRHFHGDAKQLVVLNTITDESVARVKEYEEFAGTILYCHKTKESENIFYFFDWNRFGESPEWTITVTTPENVREWLEPRLKDLTKDETRHLQELGPLRRRTQ